MALVRFAAYLSTDPDPTAGADLLAGSAWATSYAVTLDSQTAPVADTDDQLGPELTGLSAGTSYKVAIVYDDAGDYQSLRISGVVATDAIEADVALSVAAHVASSGGALAERVATLGLVTALSSAGRASAEAEFNLAVAASNFAAGVTQGQASVVLGQAFSLSGIGQALTEAGFPLSCVVEVEGFTSTQSGSLALPHDRHIAILAEIRDIKVSPGD